MLLVNIWSVVLTKTVSRVSTKNVRMIVNMHTKMSFTLSPLFNNPNVQHGLPTPKLRGTRPVLKKIVSDNALKTAKVFATSVSIYTECGNLPPGPPTPSTQGVVSLVLDTVKTSKLAAEKQRREKSGPKVLRPNGRAVTRVLRAIV